MGDPKAFLSVRREGAQKRPVAERVLDQREVEIAPSEEAVRAQASRCTDCGIPFCHGGCPLGNLIPDWNDLVYRGRLDDAVARLGETNNFPELTSRLCPAPCEAACVLGIHDEPVTIKQVERAIADHETARGAYEPRPAAVRSERRVAVVGSGPAGLACAQELTRAGHGVTVFERADRPGGLCRYGIPDFKMDKRVLDRRLDQLRAEGVVFRCGVLVGRDVTADELRGGFDAICLATGAEAARPLGVPGSDLPGVVLALDYLEEENRVVAGDRAPADRRITAEGKRVVILGGGDTGADCLGVAHRQRAASIVQLEVAPRPPDERGPSEPWPLWPSVFRVSSAHEEGGEREFSVRTARIETNGAALRLVADVPGGAPRAFDADLVLVAVGYTGPRPSPLYGALGVGLDARGRLSADDAGRTSAAHVFAMGDARRGASLIVWAIVEGRRAARSCDAFLRGRRMLRVG
jgi:glutamate synthase (NADPH/NADH) small chain